MKQNSIALRVDVSKNIGLGHLKRLLLLKKRMDLKKVFWLVNGDKKIFFSIVKKNKKTFFSNNENKMINFLKRKSINKVVMDISHQKNLLKNIIYYKQKKYIKNNLKIISFDDPKQKIISNISIIPYVVSKRAIKKHKKTLLFKGHKYFLHDIKKNLQTQNKIKNILIVISGTDPKNVAIKIYKILKDLNFNFKVILGENFKENGSFYYNKNKHHFIKRSKNLNKEFSWCDLVICGEGHTKYESILANKPTIVINQFNKKNYLLKNFTNLNVCLPIDNFKSKKREFIKSCLINYISDKKKRIRHKKNINKHFNHNVILKNTNHMIKKILSL